MNILLIGNGGHGKVVEEVSKDCGYEKIAFLDDNSVEAIGKIEELCCINKVDTLFSRILILQ